jgi:sRNA-binding carbon storage regulator CsrA
VIGVCELRGNQVRVVVQAPRSCMVLRTELLNKEPVS